MIRFLQGESRLVPLDKARLMLKHTDVYAPGETDAPIAVIPEQKSEDDDAQDLRDAISLMEKDALETYAQTHFSVKLDKRKNVLDLRTHVTQLFDQYGIS